MVCFLLTLDVVQSIEAVEAVNLVEAAVDEIEELKFEGQHLTLLADVVCTLFCQLHVYVTLDAVVKMLPSVSFQQLQRNDALKSDQPYHHFMWTVQMTEKELETLVVQ